MGLLEPLEFLHQETLVPLLSKLENGLSMNLTPKFPMEMGTVFIMEKTVPLKTLENFRIGSTQQLASRFLFLMKSSWMPLLSAFMKEMVAQAKKRLWPLSKRSFNLTSMTSSFQQSTIVLGILLNSLDLVTFLTISTN